VLTHVQKLLETSETERTDTRKVAKMEKAQQKELFFGFSFFLFAVLFSFARSPQNR
jgi:hypothetical protein